MTILPILQTIEKHAKKLHEIVQKRSISPYYRAMNYEIYYNLEDQRERRSTDEKAKVESSCRDPGVLGQDGGKRGVLRVVATKGVQDPHEAEETKTKGKTKERSKEKSCKKKTSLEEACSGQAIFKETRTKERSEVVPL